MALFALPVLLAPLLSFICVGSLSCRLSDRMAHLISIALLSIACFSGVALCFHACILGVQDYVPLFPFIQVGGLDLSWGMYIDPLSGFMLGVVTLVSLLVHIYSVGYMKGEEGVPRFMAYLGLFTFFMLLLVTSRQLVQLFVGWEGVGLASYLLIGFYFKKKSACDAAMKAFLVNRVGDVGYILGMALFWGFFGTLSLTDLPLKAADLAGQLLHCPALGAVPYVDALMMCFFVGAIGKSAQIGLHVWLPDAMEGPTPVSALIHAATMVTAGVFLMARLSPLLDITLFTKDVILVMGGITALMAATIACVQNDVKKVIAYSTCSQLGYMFMSIGVGSYDAALFHLTTHAFFKALLFLSAGSVIHSFSGCQDMREMGGCWRLIPWTYAAMWVGNLALAGLPFFAGFYSKDAILESLLLGSSFAAQFGFACGLAGVLLTAFYSWRLLFSVFHGPSKASGIVAAHVHESPWVMRAPLVVLGLGAILAGKLLYPLFMGHQAMWQGALVTHAHHAEVPLWAMLAPGTLSLLGIGLAFVLYISKPDIPTKMLALFAMPHRFLMNRWYFDWLYEKLFVDGVFALSSWLGRVMDQRLIDGLGVLGLARLSARFSAGVSALQTGFLQHYVAFICAGLALMLSFTAVHFWR